jgi:predicted dehydrogenase
VYAASWNPPWGEFRGDSTALVTIEMANGVHCMYEGAKANASSMNGWGNEYFRAECEHATLELDRRGIRLIGGGGTDRPRAEELPLLQRPVWGNGWLAEMFCDWLGGGDEVPNTLRDSMYSAAMLFAAVASAHTGKAVDVKAYLRKHLEASRIRSSRE